MSDLVWIAVAIVFGAFVLEWKLGDIQKGFKELMQERDSRLEEKLDATIDQLDRIAGILGGILAEMPHPPSKGDPYLDAMRRREK